MIGRFTSILLLALLLVGCARENMDDCITSAGPMRVETRVVPDFHSIRLSGRVDLVITQDSLAGPSVTVEAGRNLHTHIITEVAGDELRVDNTIQCNWVRSMKELPLVRITTPHLHRITYAGIGDITATTPIRAEVFRFEQFEGQGGVRLELAVDTCYIGLHTGVGDITLTGATHTAHLYTANFGHLDARALDARLVLLNSTGSGDIRCVARDALFAQLSNAGDVYYAGDPPVVEASVTGSGRLIKVD
ncbi:MAG: DUF2807 domain-containing protein [Flavobacteriales bacterium]|nr:DUF2807 domain-containing protein [Flavobacteriales bacterium]